MLYPIVGLDGESYADIYLYVEANRRFLEKMGTDLVFSYELIGLDNQPYNSALARQRADEEFIANLETNRAR